ncbi:histidine kinase [Streptomyces sp. BPTC-684]|uniref:sensor histidine kinase n=1 Tax=Streptomyces sp. BPTC-684 TaxID=3043734 RepID=UPI0024B04380|nr:histidine kinase [Streptomyces sp. BPTC-684]WHM41311.1 histidine kinase [Streptomyces sp. BPTC-684]
MSSKIQDARRRLAGPEPWSRRRTVGESALALLLALVAAGVSRLADGGLVVPALVAVAVLVLTPLRRRFPASVLIATAALSGAGAGATLLLLVVACSAGRRIVGAGRALVAFCAAFAGYLAGIALTESGEGPLFVIALFAALFFMVIAVVPGLASRYWYQRRTLLQTMQERNAQLLRERAMVAGQARLRERQRIAQDMHDSLGHQLALISVHTGALEVDPALTGRQREAVGVLREASVAAMHELRAVVGILRDGVEAPDHHTDEAQRAARGTAGVEPLVAAARAAGTTVELRETGEPRRLAPASDHAAYRIVQEALTNAYKHAPGAPIGVELRYEPDSLVVEVVNGPVAGPPPDEVVSGGQGLTGLHERARLVGGMVHTGRTGDGGFRVAGVLPYGAAEATTFVDTADDFRQQSGALPFGDGGVAGATGTGRQRAGGHVGWNVDLNVAERELAMSSRSRAGGVALGCGIAFAVVVLLAVAAGVGLFFLAGSADKATIDPAEYKDIKVGSPEQQVRDRLPDGDTFLTKGLPGKGPAEPAGSSCLVLMSSELGDSIKTEPVFRFCFKDGKLIEKQSYEVER